MFARPDHDEGTLGDLVEHLEPLLPAERAKVWDLIDQWSRKASPEAKAALRDRILQEGLTRRDRLRGLGEPILDRARQAYAALRPSDPVLRGSWLFTHEWIEVPVESTETEGFDSEDKDSRIADRRSKTVGEVYAELLEAGIVRLAVASEAPVHGRLVRREVRDRGRGADCSGPQVPG